jgi:hypothetical protein
MTTLRSLLLSALLALAACATVDTKVVTLNPALQYPPTKNVEVLLQKPARPHIDIALIESRGPSEAELLNNAREKAKVLGADAILKLETEAIYSEPVLLYDPWYDPLFYGYYRYRPFPPFPYPWSPYRVVGGGYSYVLKALAIKYTDQPHRKQETPER